MLQRRRRIATLLVALMMLVGGIAPAHDTLASANSMHRTSTSRGSTLLGGGRGLWPLRGSAVPNLGRALQLSPLPKSRALHVAVYLKIRNEAGLQRFLRDVYNPRSPHYRHFLTPRQFARRFGPSSAQQAAVVRWLRGGGLHVGAFSRNGLSVPASGTVAAVGTTFHTQLYVYRRGKERFFANARPAAAPAQVAPSVVAVTGLTDLATQRPGPFRFHSRPQDTGPSRGYTPDDIAHLYNIATLYGRGVTGNGQTIAILSFGDFDSAHLETYDSQFGLKNTVERVSVGSGASLGEGQDEAEADAEVVQGIAPAAHILVYEADNSDEGGLAMYNQVVSDKRAQVVSTSWGSWEGSNASDTITALDGLLQEAAAQGQAVFAASGDAGAYDEAQGSDPGDAKALAVDFPASDPWVTGVGGTSLQADGSAYRRETVWSDGSDPNQPLGSGGGLSVLFKRPAYQSGPGVENSYSNGMRQVPDVAADADANSGYAIYTVADHRAGWGEFGGTSASAPLWAAFAALANQVIGHPAGFLNPALYQLGQRAATFAHPPFHDITTGSNLYYPATSGWDFATGWGSFDAAAFTQDLSQLGPGAGVPVAQPSPRPGTVLTGTAQPLPTAIPTEPGATRTPSASPTVQIDAVVILRTINGQLQAVKTLRLNQKATFVATYHVFGSGSPSARLIITKNGRQIEETNLQQFTYGGKPAFGTKLTFVAPSVSGKLFAHFTVTIGSTIATRSRKFQVLTAH